jgi:GAF domain-containing protein
MIICDVCDELILFGTICSNCKFDNSDQIAEEDTEIFDFIESRWYEDDEELITDLCFLYGVSIQQAIELIEQFDMRGFEID